MVDIHCSCLVINVAVLNVDLAFTALTCSDLQGKLHVNHSLTGFLGPEAAA